MTFTYNVVAAENNMNYSQNTSLILIKKIYQSFFAINHYKIHKKMKCRYSQDELKTKADLYKDV